MPNRHFDQRPAPRSGVAALRAAAGVLCAAGAVAVLLGAVPAPAAVRVDPELTATLASIGTAGVPGVGLIMLSMVLAEVGLPVEGIGIGLGVDRLIDMSRTAVNVTGDLMATAIVAKGEGALDEAVYNRPNARLNEPRGG